MDNPQWNIKSNYILTFTVCKYGSNSERWDLVAHELANYINTTPQNCKAQFQFLCQQYDSQWHSKSSECLDMHILSIVKRLYYADLCERMTDSRDLLLVIFDFIRLFKCGRIKPNDINELLQDVKKSDDLHDSNKQRDERDQKVKMLGRLKAQLKDQIVQKSTIEDSTNTRAIDVLPIPPLEINSNFQSESALIIDENDRQVPSINNPDNAYATGLSQSPVVTESNSVFIEDEVEVISSSEDNDQVETVQTSNIDESVTNTNTTTSDQDESTFMSIEQLQVNQSPINNPHVSTNEASNSNDRDLYENASNTGLSNQSVSDNRLSNDEQAASTGTLQPDVHTINSGDRITSDSSDPIQSRHTFAVDNESYAMDSAIIAEVIPENSTDAALTVSNNDHNYSSPKEKEDSTMPKASRSRTHSVSNTFRKSVLTIFNNLKMAKYGSDFTRPLKSFKLPDEYYVRVKKPLDLPEIRERMNNGEYDDNILLFERDVLLMFTNALIMYPREFDIHGHAQDMLDYAMELFSPMENTRTPWKDHNDDANSVHSDDRDASNMQTPSLISSSPGEVDASTRSRRRLSTTPNHSRNKRQRKTIQ